MKPHAVMLKLTPMNAKEQQIDEPFKCQKVDFGEMVFLRIPVEVEASMKFSDQTKQFIEGLSLAAVQANKTFILVPEGTEILHIEERWEPLPDECV